MGVFFQACRHRPTESLLLPVAGASVSSLGSVLRAETSFAGATRLRPRVPPPLLRGDERAGGRHTSSLIRDSLTPD